MASVGNICGYMKVAIVSEKDFSKCDKCIVELCMFVYTNIGHFSGKKRYNGKSCICMQQGRHNGIAGPGFTEN